MVAKMDFKKLKDQSESRKTLKELVWFSSEKDKHHEKGSWLNNRISDALDGSDIGYQIKNCSYKTRDRADSVCGSVFCEYCREKRQISMYAAYQARVDQRFGADEDKARENLRWISVLHSVALISSDSPSQETESYNKISVAVAEMRDRITKVARTAKRRFGKEIWMRGAIHLELIDTDLYQFAGLSGSLTAKERTLLEFMESTGSSFGGKAILVHFHALMDTAGIADDDHKNLFKEYWGITTRQVLSTRTWNTVNGKKQSLRDGLKGMADYCYNGSNGDLRFNRNWGGGKKVLEYGEKIDERGITIGYANEMLDASVDGSLFLSKGDIRMLVNVHQHVSGKSGKGLLVAIY